MKVVGLLNFYDENPNWLSAYVAAMAKMCSHLVACDGAYMLFPGALESPQSSFDQVDAITRACDAAGMGLTLFTPTEPWGSEVEKRDFMFRLGPAMTMDDWFFIVDADELLRPNDWAMKDLQETRLDVAEVTLYDKIGGLRPSHTPIRRLFRALPEMHVEQAHYIVTAQKDGERTYLAGPRDFPLAAPLWLSEVLLNHLNRHRNPLRNQAAQTYYERRDELGIERLERTVEHAQR
jgi:hypothetical protein